MIIRRSLPLIAFVFTCLVLLPASTFAVSPLQSATTPSISLSPNSGTVGSTIQVSGLNFSGTDTTCSISGPIVTSQTCSVSGSALTGTFTVANVTPGTYIVTVTGDEVGDFAFANFIVTTSPDFSLGLSSYVMSIGGGGSDLNTVTITSIASFSNPVTLSTSSLPSGIHVSFSSNPATPPAGGSTTSIATVSVDSGTSPTTYSITVMGSAGSLTHSQTFALTVLPNVDFTLTLNPTSFTMPQGASSSSTVTVSSVNGFSSPVLLTYSWLGSAPISVTVTVTSSVTPLPGAPATSTLTVSSTSSSSTGSFTLELSGSSGSLAHTANLIVTISGSPCLITTATYGSAASPEVQLLRNFRDNAIMRSQAGSSFMVAFNTWYYSFSPTIANYIATHSAERAVVKVTLYPLVGILYLASTLYSPTSAYPEIAVLLSGLLASSLIGAFYLGLPLSLIRSKVRRLRYLATLEGYLGLALLGGLIALTIGEVLDSITLLMISSVAIVLSTMLLAATITSDQITKKLKTRL